MPQVRLTISPPLTVPMFLQEEAYMDKTSLNMQEGAYNKETSPNILRRILLKMPKMPSYSSLLVRYDWLGIILTLVITTTCIIISIATGKSPDLDEPVKVS